MKVFFCVAVAAIATLVVSESDLNQAPSPPDRNNQERRMSYSMAIKPKSGYNQCPQPHSCHNYEEILHYKSKSNYGKNTRKFNRFKNSNTCSYGYKQRVQCFRGTFDTVVTLTEDLFCAGFDQVVFRIPRLSPSFEWLDLMHSLIVMGSKFLAQT